MGCESLKKEAREECHDACPAMKAAAQTIPTLESNSGTHQHIPRWIVILALTKNAILQVVTARRRIRRARIVAAVGTHGI